MNKHALEHFNDSNYCFALGGFKYRIRLRTARNDDIEKVELIWDSWCRLYLGGKHVDMKIAHEDDLFSYYEADIEDKEPGYAYVFKIWTKDGKSYYYSESGLEENYNFSSCFLDEFMAVYPNDVDTIKQKHALDGRLYYQIFPERFAKSSNKKNTSYIDMDWYEDEVRNDKYMGGDLNGIKEKLPYLKDIGVGAIYLCPIHPSPSAHKYDVNDYFDIDPMFGTKEDFKSLVEEAHKLDICIVMDMVFNHSCYLGNLFRDVVKNGKKSKYYSWYFIDGDKPDYKKRNYLTFADVPMMPKLNTNNPEVIEYFKEVVTYWVRDFKLDGLRLDVAFEVSHKFWREIKKTVTLVNKDAVIYGEQWLNSYSRLDNDEWDSVMNYPYRLVLMKYLLNKENGGKYLSDSLNRTLMRYKDTSNHNMVNLLDSHDTERFLTTLNGDRDLYFIAYALTMFYPGNPEIYYGDEIFEVGKNDPYCRKGMKWNSKEYHNDDFRLFRELLRLRNTYSSLRNGEYRVHNEGDLVFIDRYNNKEHLTLVVYKGDKPISYNSNKVILSRNFFNGTFTKSGFLVAKK